MFIILKNLPQLGASNRKCFRFYRKNLRFQDFLTFTEIFSKAKIFLIELNPRGKTMSFKRPYIAEMQKAASPVLSSVSQFNEPINASFTLKLYELWQNRHHVYFPNTRFPKVIIRTTSISGIW